MRFIVIGAGGQAREVKSLIEARARRGEDVSFLGFVVSDLSAIGAEDSTEMILGGLDWLHDNRLQFDALALGIGTPARRAAVGRELRSIFGDSCFPPLIHPTAIFDGDHWQMGPGIYIGAGVIGTINVSMSPFSMLNFGCTIGHEATVGYGSVVNPGANVSGGVAIGDRVLVGSGCQILQYRTIGDDAVVGAGAVVTRDVPPAVTVVGIPARTRAFHQ